VRDEGTRPGDLAFLSRGWRADPRRGASLEARVRVVACEGMSGIMLMLADGVHEEYLTLYPDRIRLEYAGLEHAMDTTGDFHVYRIDIRGTDIAVSADGRRVIRGPGRFAHPAHQGRNQIGYGAGGSRETGEAFYDWVRWTRVPPPRARIVPGAEQVIVYKKEGVYACFPSLRIDPETETLYATFGTRVRRTHIDPTGGSACMESRDGGRTWHPAETVPSAARDERPSPVFRVADGALVEIGQNWWRRYPESRRPELAGKYYIHDNSGPGPGMIATRTGGYLRRSEDGGHTWTTNAIPELDTYSSASSGWSYGQLSDGTVLRAFAVQASEGQPFDGYVVRTRDGRAYDFVPFMRDPARRHDISEETWLHVMEDGGVWILARIEKFEEEHDVMWQAFSGDGGKSWRQVSTGVRGHPPSSVIRLQDGRLLLTYGYRHEPFGIRAVVSEDDGRTWRTDRVFVLRADGDNRDLGYPRSVQLRDGTVVTAYYFVGDDGITHIACTRWRVPRTPPAPKAQGRRTPETAPGAPPRHSANT